jgi:hypothetical protein
LFLLRGAFAIDAVAKFRRIPRVKYNLLKLEAIAWFSNILAKSSKIPSTLYLLFDAGLNLLAKDTQMNWKTSVGLAFRKRAHDRKRFLLVGTPSSDKINNLGLGKSVVGGTGFEPVTSTV